MCDVDALHGSCRVAVANLRVEKIIPQLIWFVLTVFAALMVITYVPAITLWPVELVFGE